MIVGVTGGIGSGKTTVVKLFQEFDDVAIYIADFEAKKLMNSSTIIRTKIIENFGEEAYTDNVLNRTFLAKEVFNNKNQLEVLNSIVHPEVRNHFKEFVFKNKNKAFIIYEAAILFESGSANFCNFIITVHVDLEERIHRIIARDNTTREEVLQRIHNQWKEDKKLLQTHYIICNNSLENTRIQVNKIHNILTKKESLIL